MKKAFTLVELLVVVAIIVVLLALLVPSMQRAVYLATLTKCGATLKATATGAVSYAMNAKRFYPYRGLPKRLPGSADTDATNEYITPRAVARPNRLYDIRPAARTFMSVNPQMVCPFTQPVELDQTEPDVALDGSYATWWDWHYEPLTGRKMGMEKIGDSWAWAQPGGRTERFTLLAGDFDIFFSGAGYHGSHPDRDNVLWSEAKENAVGYGTRVTFTVWWNANGTKLARGLIDMNHAFDDGSVRRYDNVARQEIYTEPGDDRMSIVPLQAYDQQATTRMQVPRQ